MESNGVSVLHAAHLTEPTPARYGWTDTEQVVIVRDYRELYGVAVSQVTSAAAETSGLSPEFQMLALPIGWRRQTVWLIFGPGLLAQSIRTVGFPRFQLKALRTSKLRGDDGLGSIR